MSQVLLYFVAYLFLAVIVLTPMVTVWSAVNKRNLRKQGKYERTKNSYKWYSVIPFIGIAAALVLYGLLANAGLMSRNDNLLHSIYFAIQAFFVNEEFPSKGININYGLFAVSPNVSLCIFKILCVLAPVATFGALASLFKEPITLIKYRFCLSGEKHIFSALNEKSLQLAEDIAYNHKNERFPPFILFTNADKDDENFSDELVASVKAFNAHCIKKHINEIGLRTGSTLYFIDIDEEKNISEAIAVANTSKKPKKIFVFSSFKSSVQLVDIYNDAEKDERCPITLINEANIIAYDLLFKHPLFSAENTEKAIYSMVIGGGTIGMEIAKTMVWCGQTLGRNFHLVVADKNSRLEEIFEEGCPGAVEKINKYAETFEAPGMVEKIEQTNTFIEFEPNMEADTSDLQRMFNKHKDANYIVVALGEDQLTYRVATLARQYYEKQRLKKSKSDEHYSSKYSLVTPVIIAVIRKNDNYKILNITSETNSNQVVYNIIPFGNYSQTFCENTVINWEIDKMAKIFDQLYSCFNGEYSQDAKTAEERNTKAVEFCRDVIAGNITLPASTYGSKADIEKRSSRAAAIHSIYKLYSISLTADYIIKLINTPEYSQEPILDITYKLIDGYLFELAELEHKRWNIYYILEGFEGVKELYHNLTLDNYSEKLWHCMPEKNTKKGKYDSKNYIIKVHKDLAPYTSFLLDKDKSFDIVFTGTIPFVLSRYKKRIDII